MSDSDLESYKKLEADKMKMLDLYIYNHLIKRQLNDTARIFQAEANISKDTAVIDAPTGFLCEWWTVFWDLLRATVEPKTSEAATSYLQFQRLGREMQKKLDQMRQNEEMQMESLPRHALLQQLSNDPLMGLGQHGAISNDMGKAMYEALLKRGPLDHTAIQFQQRMDQEMQKQLHRLCKILNQNQEMQMQSFSQKHAPKQQLRNDPLMGLGPHREISNDMEKAMYEALLKRSHLDHAAIRIQQSEAQEMQKQQDQVHQNQEIEKQQDQVHQNQEIEKQQVQVHRNQEMQKQQDQVHQNQEIEKQQDLVHQNQETEKQQDHVHQNQEIEKQQDQVHQNQEIEKQQDQVHQNQEMQMQSFSQKHAPQQQLSNDPLMGLGQHMAISSDMAKAVYKALSKPGHVDHAAIQIQQSEACRSRRKHASEAREMQKQQKQVHQIPNQNQEMQIRSFIKKASEAQEMRKQQKQVHQIPKQNQEMQMQSFLQRHVPQQQLRNDPFMGLGQHRAIPHDIAKAMFEALSKRGHLDHAAIQIKQSEAQEMQKQQDQVHQDQEMQKQQDQVHQNQEIEKQQDQVHQNQEVEKQQDQVHQNQEMQMQSFSQKHAPQQQLSYDSLMGLGQHRAIPHDMAKAIQGLNGNMNAMPRLQAVDPKGSVSDVQAVGRNHDNIQRFQQVLQQLQRPRTVQGNDRDIFNTNSPGTGSSSSTSSTQTPGDVQVLRQPQRPRIIQGNDQVIFITDSPGTASFSSTPSAQTPGDVMTDTEPNLEQK